MKMTKVASSNIKAIGYSEVLKQLHVEFKNGKTFAYTDVSKEEFAALTAAPSTGKHFNQHIKTVKGCFEAVEDWQEDLIAKQAEQIEVLREILSEVSGLRDGDMGRAADWLVDNTDDILKALSATNQDKN